MAETLQGYLLCLSPEEEMKADLCPESFKFYPFELVVSCCCHSGLPRIFFKKDSRQAGMTTDFVYQTELTL